MSKGVNRKARSDSKWKNTKKKWHTANPAVNGEYICWRCNSPVSAELVTLDHIADWALYPEYRYELSNLKPAHQFCNNEKHANQLQRLRNRKILGKRKR